MPMGFSRDPGPLPFVTIRDRDKWAPRLANGTIEIVGEHGCTMPLTMVRVSRIEPYEGEAPGHVAQIYKGKRLIAVHLEAIS